MFNDNDFREVNNENEVDFREVDTDTNEVVEVEETEDTHEDEYEDTCYICRRPESVTGKMIRIYGGLTVCNDCMQRTLDAMNNSNFGFRLDLFTNVLLNEGFLCTELVQRGSVDGVSRTGVICPAVLVLAVGVP